MGAFEKNLELIESDLEEGEFIQSSIVASIQDAKVPSKLGLLGALALTNLRVVFRGGGMMLGRESRDVSLAAITSIDATATSAMALLRMKGMTIRYSGGDVQFLLVYGGADEFLKNARLLVQKSTSPKNTASEGGLALELEKLANLLERGLIDPEEFKSAKAKLLR